MPQARTASSGPGNIYVAAAKKLLAGEVGIDFVAGPTEILIIAADGDPQFLAADMLAQAEHDADACADPADHFADAWRTRWRRKSSGNCETLPTAPVARQAIRKNSAIVLVRSLDEAVELRNRFAPEHLSIPDEALLPKSRDTRAASSSGRTVRRRRAIMRPDRIMCCRPAAWRGCAAGCRWRIT